MLDKFECTTFFSVNDDRWKIQRKARSDYINRKKEREDRKKEYHKEKLNIEFYSLLQGFRTVLKQMNLNEWMASRQKNAEWMKQKGTEQVDLKVIEDEIDKTIQEAFTEVIQKIRQEFEERAKKSVEELL